jgi:hypothetical protein
VFCGATPLTNEHVFGQWTSEFFSMEEKSNAELSKKYVVRQDKNALGENEVVFEDRGLDIPVRDVTVKVVCGPCNNGWMGDIELNMKRLYARMVAGKVPLSPDDVALLRRWALKTAVMWQYNYPSSASVTKEQLAALHKNDEVPGASVRFGRRQYWERDSLFIFGSGIETAVADDWELGTERTIDVTLIAIGPLVFVITLGHYHDEARMASLGNFPGHKVRPLKSGLTWPGAFKKMNVSQFDSLVYALGFSGHEGAQKADPELLEYLKWQRAAYRGK